MKGLKMKESTLSTIATFTLLIGVLLLTTLPSNAKFQGPQGPALQNPGRKLQALSLTETSVIGGNKFLGSVRLQFLAPNGGTRVSFSTDPAFNPEGGNAAFVPSGVTVSQGSATATFEVTTFPVQFSRQVTIRATAGGVTRTVSFTVQPVQVGGFVITPTFGVGPFNARASVILNAPAVAETEVILTSSNPAVVGFGPLGTLPTRTVTFQQGERSLTGISVRTRSVQQVTTVTISATLHGSTQSRPMRIEPLQ
jgi:hypothetical protein